LIEFILSPASGSVSALLFPQDTMVPAIRPVIMAGKKKNRNFGEGESTCTCVNQEQLHKSVHSFHAVQDRKKMF